MKIDESVLDTIAGLARTSDPRGILSVYLPIDPATSPHMGFEPALMDTLRAIDAPDEEVARSRLAEESARVLSFVRDNFQPQGSALVIFSSEPAGIWQTLNLQDAVPGLAVFGSQPYVLPLRVLAEDLPPTVLALVGHEHARILRLTLGQLQASGSVESDVPGRQRQGGWAAFRIERDRQHHIEEHYRTVAERLEEMERESVFRYLVVAGTDDNRHGLVRALTDHLRDKVVGQLPMEMFSPDSEMVDAARKAVKATQRREEEAEVRAVIDAALARGKGVVGQDQTMQRLREGRVHKLLLAGSLVFTSAGEKAATLAEAGGSDLAVVHGQADELLRPYAGMAASLRY